MAVSVIDELENLEIQAREAIKCATSLSDLEAVRVRFLGRKGGAITGALRGVSSLSAEERPLVGQRANELKNTIQALIDQREAAFKEAETTQNLQRDFVDITLPGRRPSLGGIHPINQIIDRAIEIFVYLGFEVVDGPEIETDYYNFEALNVPRNHPARDMHDTFYVQGDRVLRTQTSAVWARYMEKYPPPIAIISPGKVYRCEAEDASHTVMFQQIDGLWVDEHITFGDLRGVLEVFVHQMFSPDSNIRFRPSFFPFTEPSAEVDMQCFVCKGSGCRVCKGTGWIEILGSGMVHPNVLRAAGYDTEKYQGLAFGMGVERITMLKYGVNDIRYLYSPDVRILNQF